MSDDGLLHDRCHVDDGPVRAGRAARVGETPEREGDREVSESQMCLECLEQARLLGMGAERELRLIAERDELRKTLHRISLASQNSISSQRECGAIARAALAKSEK